MGQRWVTSAATIDAIADVDADIADRVFGSAYAVALGGWPGATTGRAWASHATFVTDVASGGIAPKVRVVMYDPENWVATPPPERQDPVSAIEAFGALARSRGYSVLITPHPNLVSVRGSVCQIRAGETREAAYLRSGIIEASAANADAYETQAQSLQRDPAAYRTFVMDTAQRARTVNGDVRVLSGLSTHPGYAATAEMLHDAWESVRDVVDGHYLSLARRRLPSVAASFLAMTTTARR